MKVLLISLGSIGKRHLDNIRTLLPQAEVALLRLKSRDRQGVAEGINSVFFDIDDALKFNPTLVIISSPANEHVDNAVLFIKNGAHVFIEKPLAVTYHNIGELLSANHASDGFSMVGYVLRFQPILHVIKQQIDNGELGVVRTARVEVGQYLPDWRPDSDYRQGVSAQRALGGGALLELSHELDYATWLFGDPDHLICSSGKLSDLDIDVEDSACVVMEYGKPATNKRVVVQVDFLQRTANMAVQIVGSKATLHADLIKEELFITSAERAEPVYLDVPKMKNTNDMYLRQFDFFLAQSLDNYQTHFPETPSFSEFVTVERAATVLRLVDQAKRSNSEGKRLTFSA